MTTILFANEFIHTLDNENGTVALVEGPRRFVLPPHQSIFKEKAKKLVLREGEYSIIRNPWNEEKKMNIMGASFVLKGPVTRSLFPLETFSGIKKAVILLDNEGTLIMALNDTKEHKAGERFMIKGPTSYIPSKNEQFIKKVVASQVSQNEAIYIRNTLTSELKLVKGPRSYLPSVYEELYQKRLSEDEIQTLGVKSPNHMAYQIQIQKNEALCVIDYQTNEERYIIGPRGYRMGAHEGVKVISRSGGLPKKEGVRKLGVIRLGPDFLQDLIQVRTRDNAVLEMLITYKWKFILSEDELHKIFHGDFVGYTCQSMRSRVREEVSKHDFETFHTNSSGILREKLFKDYEIEITKDKGKKVKEKFHGRFFSEFNFLIFQLDVKKIRPVDKDIERLLDNAIKSSMSILVKKKKEQALFEQKRSEIKNRIQIEKLKTELIRLENQNYRKQTVERAKIEGRALVEACKAESEANATIQNSKLDLEIQELREKMELLKGSGGDAYVDFRIGSLMGESVENVTIVPGNTTTLIINKK